MQKQSKTWSRCPKCGVITNDYEAHKRYHEIRENKDVGFKKANDLK